MHIILNHEQDTLELGARLAELCQEECIIFLQGALGVGKTTFVRGFLQGLGFSGRVKSPTYSLVENYVCGNKTILHFDLYRLQDPWELEAIGIRDYLSFSAIWLIEWPDKAFYPDKPNIGFLPMADLKVLMHVEKEKRSMQFDAITQRGQHLLSLFQPIALAQDGICSS